MNEYFSYTRFVDHQLDPYNEFIRVGMQNIVDREPTLNIPSDNPSLVIKVEKIFVETPKFVHPDRSVSLLTPNEARLRNVSYEGGIMVSISSFDLKSNKSTFHQPIMIGKIPIMLRSSLCNLKTDEEARQHGECEFDYGGYFIIKGRERVLISQLRKVYNKVFVEYNPTEKYKFLAEIRSMNEQGSSVLIQAKARIETNELFFSLPYMKTLLEAGVVFKALGATEDEMLDSIRVEHSRFVNVLKIQYNSVQTSKDALKLISDSLGPEKDVNFVLEILRKEIFYHFRFHENSNAATVRHLGFILKKLVETVMKTRPPDDKENLANKRLDSTGALLHFIFQGLFKQFLKTVSAQLNKKPLDFLNVMKSQNVITSGFNSCFLTGNWCTQKNSSFVRVGVSQILSVQNFGAKLSHLKRIAIPIGKKGKNQNMRQIHTSQEGFICPYETPESDAVGLVLNLTLASKISIEARFIDCFRWLSFIDFQNFTKQVLVLLNGEIIGSTDDPKQLYDQFNFFRLSGLFEPDNSFVWLRVEKEIHISSDEGRLLRPVFILKDGVLNRPTSWVEGIKNGTIAFRDVWELENSVVALEKSSLKLNKNTFMEICPAATMTGGMAAAIPLANHCQSPRNAYQASMGKQAIGIPSLTYRLRYDTTLHVLNTPQKSIITNKLSTALRFEELPSGCLPIVAIMTYTGFNQEDSIILNRSSLERGLFCSTTYKTILEEEKKRGNSDYESICSPKFQYRRREWDYSFIDETTGVISFKKIKKDMWLTKGVVVIGKTHNKMVKNEAGDRVLETRDVSITIKNGEEGFLDSVLDTLTNEGVRIIKIRIRTPRFPEIGDKFASSTAQKGTCGLILDQEDMPYDCNGVVPDLILNPHAIPSRMTINMLIAMAFNLISLKSGTKLDSTTFAWGDESIENALEKWAEETGLGDYMTTMYSGFTGEKFKQKIFMAPAYYQRLKHLVSEKIHSRMFGPIDSLTRQPVAGRSREGGLRIGEMEKDCLLSHGSVRILKECLYDKSDKYTIPVCTSCHTIANKQTYCSSCQNSEIELKITPYATKLVFDELKGMGIKVSLT